MVFVPLVALMLALTQFTVPELLIVCPPSITTLLALAAMVSLAPDAIVVVPPPVIVVPPIQLNAPLTVRVPVTLRTPFPALRFREVVDVVLPFRVMVPKVPTAKLLIVPPVVTVIAPLFTARLPEPEMAREWMVWFTAARAVLIETADPALMHTSSAATGTFPLPQFVALAPQSPPEAGPIQVLQATSGASVAVTLPGAGLV